MQNPKVDELTILDHVAIEMAKQRFGAHVPHTDRPAVARHCYLDAEALLKERAAALDRVDRLPGPPKAA